MGRNLTNLNISSSFQHLLQISSSNSVNDGTGSLVTELDITASNATSASYAVTASYAENGGGVTSIIAGTNITVDQSTGDVTISAIGGAAPDTGSLLVTSSAVNDTITFTKGDGSTYTNVINNVSASLSAQEIFVIAKNIQGSTIPKGFAVHSSGVTGQNINITTASYDDANIMPAICLLYTSPSPRDS